MDAFLEQAKARCLTKAAIMDTFYATQQLPTTILSTLTKRLSDDGRGTWYLENAFFRSQKDKRALPNYLSTRQLLQDRLSLVRSTHADVKQRQQAVAQVLTTVLVDELLKGEDDNHVLKFWTTLCEEDAEISDLPSPSQTGTRLRESSAHCEWVNVDEPVAAPSS
jgi:hypothetical protein